MSVTTKTEMIPEAAVESAPETETSFRRFVSDFTDNKIAVSALIVFVAIICIAVFAPLISPQDPYDLTAIDILDSRLPPRSEGWTGMHYWLGTDDQGRDMLSAIFYGLRTSLAVGAMSGFIALCLGACIGLIAAYFGGRIDTLIMRLVDLQLSFPAILIALMLLAILGKGVDKIIIALIAVQWAYYARTVRGSALVERSKDYIEAAHCLALTNRRIVFRHLLPNVLGPCIVQETLQIPNYILLEAFLSFIGLGVDAPTPSWGIMIQEGYQALRSSPHILFAPAAALTLTVLAFNFLGDGLRDALDPRLRE